jgi:SAM-dependent methyltransferase
VSRQVRRVPYVNADDKELPQELKPIPFLLRQYWEDRLHANYSLKGVGCSRFGSHYNQWLYRVRERVLRRELASLKLDLTEANVLDVGSGTGFYVDFWRRQGVRSVSGCDLTETAVSGLQNRFPGHRFFQCDIGGDLPPGVTGQFDVVSAFDLLYHIVDDARYETAFHNISRLLVTGGLFCFSELFLHRDAERGIHVVFRPLSHIERLLAESGFEILTRRPVFVSMNEPLDTESAATMFIWKLMMQPARMSETLGWLWGAALSPVDLLLTRFMKESPSTEMMLCRKIRRLGQWRVAHSSPVLA